MKILHSQKRAKERYFIFDFCPSRAIGEILNDRCVQIEENYERYSRVFMIIYFNKYIKVVTDFNINYVKTVLPLKLKNDFDFVEKLNSKISKLNERIYEV